MADLAITLTHQTSHRVTANISYHSFSVSTDGTSSCPALGKPWLRACQNATLQFPRDLDPVAGLSEEERRCTFTPCAGGTNRNDGLAILTRNGRITGLLGLPRPYRTLTAEVVDVGGGFPESVIESIHRTGAICIAGGTGIAPFMTMGGAIAAKLHLLWSVGSDDFGFVEFVLEKQLLRVEQWSRITVFVTSGEDAGGRVVKKPATLWTDKFSSLRFTYPGLGLEKRRTTQGDMVPEVKAVLFCGSKSLEWQIRMWTMGTADVYCTEAA
ncbi:hypothetical protein F503_00720 [Ophiostoma piceae UAMH 11346]|uniref:FAD-binding FR-type domain-containing protein n=1 Tax=Ophiostoma piceae (strain UAMH 11346) TaxID=1262450 RepID=S3BPZ6_OPHP1|nr:hypothetical protein F503_00720 [Ophiostoma piceae UAMH 11346]